MIELEQLYELDLEGVACSAAVQADGDDWAGWMLTEVGGMWQKLGTQLMDRAHRGLVHTVVVAYGQKDIPAEYLGEDAVPLRVIKAVTLGEAVTLLNELSRPRRAVCNKEREECKDLELFTRAKVPLVPESGDSARPGLFQLLPLLREVKREELPKESKARGGRGGGRGESNEDENEDKDRGIDLVRWEEEQRGQRVTYEPFPLELAFSNFAAAIKESPRKPINQTLPRFFVIGPPGSGKSTVVRYLAWRAASGQLRVGGRSLVPARVSLRDWETWLTKRSLAETSLPDYLAGRDAFKNLTHAATADHWRRWLRRGEALLLLDGLDETNQATKLLQALKTTLSVFTACPVVITCRTVSFEEHRAAFELFPVFTLGGLERAQRDAYIRAWPAAHPDKFSVPLLIQQLDRNPQMTPLAANPLLLSILCFVADDPRGMELPARRSELYDRAMDKLLDRHRADAEVRFKDRLPPKALRRGIISRAALELFLGQDDQSILTVTEQVLLEKLTKAAAQAGFVTDAGAVATAIFDDLKNNCGLLRGNDSEGHFFLHFTLEEFLAADGLAHLIEPPKAKTRWEEKADFGVVCCTPLQLVDAKAWDTHFRELIALLAGRLKDPVPLLKLLGHKKRDDLFRHRLALGAYCLPEATREKVLESMQSSTEAGRTRALVEKEADLLATCALKYCFSEWYRPKPFPSHKTMLPALTCRQIVVERLLELSRDDQWSFPRKAVRWMFEPKKGWTRVISWGLWPLHILHLSTGGDSLHRGLSHLDDWMMLKQLGWPFLGYFVFVRPRAVQALRAMGPSAATPKVLARLLELTRDNDSGMRSSVVEALGAMGPAAATPETLARLLELIRDSKWWLVQFSVVKALGAMGPAAATPETLARLSELVRDVDFRVRSSVVEALGAMGPAAATPETLARLLELTRDNDSDVRSSVVKAFKTMGSAAATPETLARLNELVRDVDFRVRSSVVEALGAMGPAAATPETLARLLELTRDNDSDVRSSVVKAFKTMGSAAATPEVLARLLELTRDNDSDVRCVLKALGAMGPAAATPETLARLLELIRDSKWWLVQSSVVEALGAMGAAAATPETLARLNELVWDDDFHVRSSVVEALGTMGPAAATPETLARLLKLVRTSDGARSGWGNALRAMGSAAATPETLARLLELSREIGCGWAWEAVWALGAMGPAAATPETLARLLELTWDEEPNFIIRFFFRWRATVRLAVSVLGSMGPAAATPETLARLLELIRDDDSEVRWAAADALRAMGPATATPESLNRLIEFFIDEYLENNRAALTELEKNGVRIFKRWGRISWTLVAELSRLPERDSR